MAHDLPPATSEIIPPRPPEFIKKIIDDNKKLDEQYTEADDVLLAELAASDAWRVLRRILVHKKVRLQELTARTVRDNPGDLQEVGLRYLISDQLGNLIDDVINRVELSKKAKELSDESHP